MSLLALRKAGERIGELEDALEKASDYVKLIQNKAEDQTVIQLGHKIKRELDKVEEEKWS